MTHHIPLVRTETAHSYNGFNYVEINIDHGYGGKLDTTFECNCSIFKTKKQVQDFIELVFN